MDMLGIFEDVRRENGRISPYPFGTERIWPGIARGDMGGAPPDHLSGGRPLAAVALQHVGVVRIESVDEARIDDVA